MNIINFEKLKENKQHGDTMFPAALYSVNHNAAGNILPHHWHSELEFIFLTSGEAVFTINDIRFLVHPGECVFVNGGQLHSGLSLTDTTSYFSVVFDTNFLTSTFDACNKFFDGIKNNKYKILQHYKPEIPCQGKLLIELKDTILELANKDIAYELTVKSKLLSIFSTIFRNSLYTIVLDDQKNLIATKKYDILKQILGYIYQNYNQKIKLTDIGALVDLTPQYLCKLFKEMTNMSIVDYINHYRIETAISLLKINTLSITDIAFECGFDNISYFNRVFKKQMTCTPSEYRSKSFM